MQPSTLPNSPVDIPDEAEKNSSPQTDHKIIRTALKIIGLVIAIAAYTGIVSFSSIALYKKSQKDRINAINNAINPHKIVQQALVNDLSLNTVTRHVTYRDNIDRGMLVTWDTKSDFSNYRDPKSSGTLTVNYVRGKTNNTQQVEFVAVKGADEYTNKVYVRMVKGNEITNASSDWYTFQTSSSWTVDNLKDLYQRNESKNSFTSQIQIPGFDNFKGFNIPEYNSPAAYIITAKLRDTQEKAKIVSELQNDKAYALQNCDHNTELSWCSGSTNTGGLSSINTNLATSEGGSGGLTGQVINSSQFWFTADNSKKQITKLEVDVSYTGNSDKYIVEYSNYGQAVMINIPQNVTPTKV